jgi:hypothetical protein
VMRSPGGNAPRAMNLSNILRDKNATVVVYDYCFSACANYFLIASSRTFLMKDTIVAWHGGPQPWSCRGVNRETLEKRYQDWSRDPQAPKPFPPLDEICELAELSATFFKERGVGSRHIHEPQTFGTRKMVRFAQGQTWDKRSILWMWHPRNHGDYFKSIVSYESYPTSQDQVDEILARIGGRVRIFYDYDDR